MPVYVAPPLHKSPAVATVLTVLWPGLGHYYLGLIKRGTPYFVWNAVFVGIGILTFGLTLILSFIVWLVTLLLTVGSIADEAQQVNYAIATGQSIQN